MYKLVLSIIKVVEGGYEFVKLVLSCSMVVGGGYKAVLSGSKVVKGGYKFVQTCMNMIATTLFTVLPSNT